MKKIIYFFLTAVAISSALGILFPNPVAYTAGVLIAVWLWGRFESVVFEKKRQTIPWLLLAILIPLFYSLSVLNLFSASGITIFALSLLQLPLILTGAFFEEIGWRGFLFKELEKFGWIKMNITIGLLWAAWHLPAILTNHYSIVTPLPIGLFFFFINLILLSFLFGWFRQKTSGILAPIFLHTFHNLAYAGNDYLYLGESSVGLTLVLLLVFMLFKAWKKSTPL